MKISSNGIELIKKYEGCILTAYLCPAGVWTIGWGHTGGVKKGMVISKYEAEKLLSDDLLAYEAAVNKANLAINQNQFDALVSFCYNVGPGNFNRSTLLKKAKVNPNDKSIALEFAKWVNGGGKRLLGLVKRRADESNLYFS